MRGGRSRVRSGVVAVLGLIACGGGGDDAAVDAGADGGDLPEACVARSGDRLRLQVVEGGGAVLTFGLYDSAYEVACDPAEFDGVLRCVPSDVSGGQVFFRASDCTDPILLPNDGANLAPVYRRLTAVDACTALDEYRTIGASDVIVADEPLWTDLTGDCVEIPADAGTYYALGAPLTGDDLVELTATSLGGDGRIDVRTLEGADGSRMCTGTLRDRDLDADCLVQRAEDGEPRCLPHGVEATAVFPDSECQPPTLDVALHDARCGAAAPRWIGRSDDGFCLPRTRLRVVGEALGGTVHAGSPGDCEPIELGGEGAAYEPGPDQAPFGFVAPEPVRADTGGRLEVEGWRFPGGVEAATGALYDRELEASCAFQPNGLELRCLPIEQPDAPQAEVVEYYADGACLVPELIGRLRGTCDEESPRFARRFEFFTQQIYVIGDPWDAAIYEWTGEECLILDQGGDRWFALDGALPASTFVLGSVRTE